MPGKNENDQTDETNVFEIFWCGENVEQNTSIASAVKFTFIF